MSDFEASEAPVSTSVATEQPNGPGQVQNCSQTMFISRSILVRLGNGALPGKKRVLGYLYARGDQDRNRSRFGAWR